MEWRDKAAGGAEVKSIGLFEGLEQRSDRSSFEKLGPLEKLGPTD